MSPQTVSVKGTFPYQYHWYKRFNWGLYLRFRRPLPKPSKAEIFKVKRSMGLLGLDPLPRCPGKGDMAQDKGRSIRKRFEDKGDFSHSAKDHKCEVCRCKRVAGAGTRHYGVGYCFWHDVDQHKRFSKAMAIAIQQGYPLDPIKYKSDREYIEDVRRQAGEAENRLGLGEELNLLRAHLQEIEELYSKKDASALTMRSRSGDAVPMTDDVKLDRIVKMARAISAITRDSYVITESDYVHVDECKAWLWGIYKMIEGCIGRLITGELGQNELLAAIQNGFKEVTMPKTGRRKK